MIGSKVAQSPTKGFEMCSNKGTSEYPAHLLSHLQFILEKTPKCPELSAGQARRKQRLHLHFAESKCQG